MSILITVKQAAEILQVSERTIFNLMDTGKLASVKIGSARRIPRDAVQILALTGATLPTLVERREAMAS